MDGIILVNKPKGITSYDVIRTAKKILKTNKIGHTGTLDPFAEGLLILCVGKATKLVNNFINADKVYEGILKLNNHYDTYDVTGNIISSDDKVISYQEIKSIEKDFTKTYLQAPPIYSAIKKDGKKLYEYARSGIDIEVEKREVSIYSLNFSDTKVKNEFEFITHVSKGTYIRSLAVDIASSLGTFGALKELKRIKIAKYSINDAVDLDLLTKENIIDIPTIYKDANKLILNDYMIKLVKNGIYLDERQIITDSPFLVYDEANNLIALYECIENNTYKPLIIF
ncbi:tRNA pseudouridine(55) synthase TruB [Haploplasma axanthum]|uniref:tRNA pseudouridine synthase B n=1 Tax=Haploplasma axanthum TaxID=29552 RepID=A0A449BEA9_HAPAX|nr:tRNA pseudouridine(55) synthase TruB [Haploplasma axanthum]VEU80789.1 tRNA pseudouridine synthase B [Haploplasma axanthum]